jgi:hypothetical protein
MDEEEVTRLLRTRARAWRGARASAEQSRWAQPGAARRGRWAWLPAMTALVCVALFSAAAAAYAGGPAPVRRVLAPVGDRVPLPWRAERSEDRPNLPADKLGSEPAPGTKASHGSTAPSIEPSEKAPRAVPNGVVPVEREAPGSSPKRNEDSGTKPDNKPRASVQPSSPSPEPSSQPQPSSSSHEPSGPGRDG